METEPHAGVEPDLVGLVERARTDREAFGRLYDMYYLRIYRYCLRRLFVQTVAEDVCSDVFLQVARHIGGFGGTTQEAFSRWLYAIATNSVNAYVRQTQRRQELLREASRQRAIHAPQEGSRSPVDTLDWPGLHAAILSLKPRDQAIVTLRFFEDLSCEQIAQVLEMRAGAVRAAEGFRVQGKDGQVELWGDPQSGLPLHVRLVARVQNVPLQILMSDFQFNVPIDESLFSTEVPAGFELLEVVDRVSPVKMK